jgi:hypothetical protein
MTTSPSPVLPELPALPEIRLDETGVPILDDVVEMDPALEALTAELRRQLPTLAREAFTEAIKQVALTLKHDFEHRLSRMLDDRLDELVTAALHKTKQSAEN